MKQRTVGLCVLLLVLGMPGAHAIQGPYHDLTSRLLRSQHVVQALLLGAGDEARSCRVLDTYYGSLKPGQVVRLAHTTVIRNPNEPVILFLWSREEDDAFWIRHRGVARIRQFYDYRRGTGGSFVPCASPKPVEPELAHARFEKEIIQSLERIQQLRKALAESDAIYEGRRCSLWLRPCRGQPRGRRGSSGGCTHSRGDVDGGVCAVCLPGNLVAQRLVE